MLNNIIEILQIVNFISIITLYLNLKDTDTNSKVDKMFKLYGLYFILTLMTELLFILIKPNQNVEFFLTLIFISIKIGIVTTIAINLRNSIKKISKVACWSYITMTTSLITFVILYFFYIL